MIVPFVPNVSVDDFKAWMEELKAPAGWKDTYRWSIGRFLLRSLFTIQY
jgi:hypothetical protein